MVKPSSSPAFIRIILTRKLFCTKAEFAPRSKGISQGWNVQHQWLLSEVAIKDLEPWGFEMRI